MQQIQVSMVCFVALYLACFLINASVARIPKQPNVENLLELKSRASNWNCHSDSDCTPTKSFCLSGSCECPAGYVFNIDMTSCIKVATAFGVACNETLQCTRYLLSGATCTNQVCSCGTGYHYLHGRCYPTSGLNEKCEADVNCYVNADVEATTCENGTCQCTEGWYQREYRTCRRAGYAVGDECTIDNDCTFDDAAYCNSNRACVLDVDDGTKSTFGTKSMIPVHHGYLRSTRDVNVGSSCKNDTDCEDLGNAKCGSDETCVCGRAHFASATSTSCVPELGEACTENDEVHIGNSVCRNGTWRCTGATVSSENNQICRKTTKSYGSSCLYDEQCYIFGPDSSCQSKKCVCNEGSHWVESELFCWINRGMNENCRANEDCYVVGSNVDLFCKDFVCSCPNGTHANSNGTVCVKEVTAFGDPCEADGDCTILNSVCLDGACTCSDPYYKLNNECATGINASCTMDDDCGPDYSRCSSNLCTCPDDYVAQSVDTCVAVSSYGGKCSHDIQCSSTMENTMCSITGSDDPAETTSNNGTCTCTSGYQYRFKRCYAKKALGDGCTSLGECYLDSDIFMVTCLNGICTCDWRYSRVNGTSCRTNDATMIFTSTWLGLAILITGLSLI